MSTPSQSNPESAPHRDRRTEAGSPPPSSSEMDRAGMKQIRHTLRTPINHILGYCEMLLEETGIPDRFRRDLERIYAGGRQLLNLINQHFDRPRLEDQPSDLHRLYHDLRTPVNHVVGYCELLQEEAADLGKPQWIPELQKIRDAAITWLTLMEENLNLRASRVPAAPRPVPLPPSANAGARVDEPAAPRTRAEKGMEEGGKLLIVDDDQDNRDLLARRLQRHGYQVAVAANGLEAMELIQARKFDLVLLDLIMPGLGGVEVLRRVRQRRSMTDLPMIVLTGMDASTDVVEALRFGANDYLTKPTDFGVVLARTETHLRLKHAQAHLKARMEEIRRLAGALEKRNRFIQQIFGRYVTDEVVENLLETPEGLKLGGEKREVSILMSDLRGFTALAEQLPPERVVEMLNIYLGEMTGIIAHHAGVIDEFIGDAILAIFGAPIRDDDHPERAVACALSMQLAMARVNEQLARLTIPHLEMGIGINTGRVVVGNIGSIKRAKFGVVGTPVNVAARIQAAANGGEILVADATAGHLASLLSVREKRSLTAKGVTEPVIVHVTVGLAGEYNLRLPKT